MREGVMSKFSYPPPLWGRVAPHEVGRRVRGILPPGKLCKDVLQYSRGALQDIVVQVARRLKSLSCKCCFAARVALRFRVLTAIDLDDQTFLEAHEVENVILERNLPTKF